MKYVESILCAALLAVCAASAAADTDEPLSVILDQPAYVLGDTVGIVVTNHTDDTALFTLVCNLFWEGRAGERWETVYVPDCSNVRVQPTRLAGKEDLVAQIIAAPCESRMLGRFDAFRVGIRVQFEDDGGYLAVYSSEVSITAP